MRLSEWNRGWIGLNVGGSVNYGFAEEHGLAWGAQTGGGARIGSLNGDLRWRVLLCGARSSLSLECSCEKLERVYERCKWFSSKIKPEMVLQSMRVTLRSTRKLISIWSNFPCLPNRQRSVKWFPETLFSQNKCSLRLFDGYLA